jgi:uncharacterized protein (TIGR02466 family)
MIYELFPHPLYEGIIDEDSKIDNNKLVESIESSISKGEHKKKMNWQCEVITSIGQYDINERIFFKENNLGNIIKNYANDFAIRIGLLEKFQQLELKEIWYNSYDETMWQEKHNHYGAFISGVYYPIDSDIPLEFYTPNHLHQQMDSHNPLIESQFSTPVHRIYPQAGKLILFRSYMEHGVQYRPPVEQRQTSKNRLSIAFNYVIVRK